MNGQLISQEIGRIGWSSGQLNRARRQIIDSAGKTIASPSPVSQETSPRPRLVYYDSYNYLPDLENDHQLFLTIHLTRPIDRRLYRIIRSLASRASSDSSARRIRQIERCL